MATSDQDQKSILVKQHKRIAQGEKLDGTSYQPKNGQSNQGDSKAKKNK